MTEPRTDVSTLAGPSPPNLRAPQVASDEGRNLRVFSWPVRHRRRIERTPRPNRGDTNGRGQRIGGEAEGTGRDEEDEQCRGHSRRRESGARAQRSAGCAATSRP